MGAPMYAGDPCGPPPVDIVTRARAAYGRIVANGIICTTSRRAMDAIDCIPQLCDEVQRLRKQVGQ